MPKVRLMKKGTAKNPVKGRLRKKTAPRKSRNSCYA